MEFRAQLRRLRMSARKARPVADLIRGKRAEEAIHLLGFLPRKASGPMRKLIQSAVANAAEQSGIDVDTLYVKTVTVDEGPTLKRFMPRAMGRATPIRKRSSHITVVLDER